MNASRFRTLSASPRRHTTSRLTHSSMLPATASLSEQESRRRRTKLGAPGTEAADADSAAFRSAARSSPETGRLGAGNGAIPG